MYRPLTISFFTCFSIFLMLLSKHNREHKTSSPNPPGNAGRAGGMPAGTRSVKGGKLLKRNLMKPDQPPSKIKNAACRRRECDNKPPCQESIVLFCLDRHTAAKAGRKSLFPFNTMSITPNFKGLKEPKILINCACLGIRQRTPRRYRQTPHQRRRCQSPYHRLTPLP